jgi:hypothetical protein
MTLLMMFSPALGSGAMCAVEWPFCGRLFLSLFRYSWACARRSAHVTGRGAQCYAGASQLLDDARLHCDHKSDLFGLGAAYCKQLAVSGPIGMIGGTGQCLYRHRIGDWRSWSFTALDLLALVGQPQSQQQNAKSGFCLRSRTNPGPGRAGGCAPPSRHVHRRHRWQGAASHGLRGGGQRHRRGHAGSL